jgi:hypothetical protein
MSAVVDAAEVTLPPEPTIAQDIKAGLLGLAIAVGCFFVIIPVVHFIAIGGGPGFGGFFASARIRARGKHTAIIGLTIGVGEAIAVAIIATILIATHVVGTDMFSLFMAVGAVFVTLLYASTLGTVGAYIGGRGT